MSIIPSLRCARTGLKRTVDQTPFSVASLPDENDEVHSLLTEAEAFTINHGPVGFSLIPGGTVAVNGKRIETPVYLKFGDRISVGSSLYFFEEESKSYSQTEIKLDDERQKLDGIIELPEGMSAVFGREQSSQVKWLNHVQVSLRHAEVIKEAGGVMVRDLDSSNGTFINGCRIGRSWQEVGDGQLISIGPFDFVLSRGRLLSPERQVQTRSHLYSNGKLECRGFSCDVKGTNRKKLLKDINLSIEPGQFVCLLGPSGAGKSTLLKSMSNRMCLDRFELSGSIQLNGFSVQEDFELLKARIAYVPQHEILYDSLTLRMHLRFTSRLRLPLDLTNQERDARIEEILATVQLSDCGDRTIRNLSGGQRKRAALANELLADPDIIFLDEVTSGLDEMIDQEMMSLFRKISRTGKTVICVTHSLSNVPEYCDQVVCLTTFGRLAFVGDPAKTLDYFEIESLPKVYPKLSVASPDQASSIANRFQRPGTTSKVTAIQYPAEGSHRNHGPNLAVELISREFWPQLKTMFERGVQLLILDHKTNLFRGIQCLVVGVLLWLVFRDQPQHVQQCSFIMALSCFWFGANNTAKEIVKERANFEQERNVVAKASSFVVSKFLLLGIISLCQAALLALMVRHLCDISCELSGWLFLASSLSLAGVGFGLAISAFAKNEEVAVAAIPILLIPQIILSGAIVPLEGVNEFLAQIGITCYWGFEEAKDLLETQEGSSENKWLQPFFVIGSHLVLGLWITWWGMRTRKNS